MIPLNPLPLDQDVVSDLAYRGAFVRDRMLS